MVVILGTSVDDTLTGGDENDSIYGGRGSDRLTGVAGSDALVGSYGNDILEGGDGNDTLIGAGRIDQYTGAVSRGAGEIDILTGGSGTDTFVFSGGSARGGGGPSYRFNGSSDYALITDFNKSEDIISLALVEFSGSSSTTVEYSLGATPEGSPIGTGIYVNNLGTQPDLIAILQDVSPDSVSLSDSYFNIA